MHNNQFLSNNLLSNHAALKLFAIEEMFISNYQHKLLVTPVAEIGCKSTAAQGNYGQSMHKCATALQFLVSSALRVGVTTEILCGAENAKFFETKNADVHKTHDKITETNKFFYLKDFLATSNADYVTIVDDVNLKIKRNPLSWHAVNFGKLALSAAQRDKPCISQNRMLCEKLMEFSSRKVIPDAVLNSFLSRPFVNSSVISAKRDTLLEIMTLTCDLVSYISDSAESGLAAFNLAIQLSKIPYSIDTPFFMPMGVSAKDGCYWITKQ